MTKQVSIFDVMPRDTSTYPDWHDMTPSDLAMFFNSLLGTGFVYDEAYSEYFGVEAFAWFPIAKSNKTKVQFYKGTIYTGEPRLFVNYDNANCRNYHGFGGGEQTTEAAVKAIDRAIADLNKEENRIVTPIVSNDEEDEECEYDEDENGFTQPFAI